MLCRSGIMRSLLVLGLTRFPNQFQDQWRTETLQYRSAK